AGPARRTRTGAKGGRIGLSAAPGHYEAVVFSEGLAQFRDRRGPGKAVLLALWAEVQGDEVRARIQMTEPLDAAAAKLSKGLRVFLRNDAPLDSIDRRLDRTAGNSVRTVPERTAPDKADGEVSMVLLLAEGT